MCDKAKMLQRRKGGVALEYVLVSTFAGIVTTVALGFMAHVAKKKLEALSQSVDVPIEELRFSLWESTP